jgi:hypothetical protein
VEVVSPSNGYTITYGTTNGTYDLNEMPTYTNPGSYEVYYKIEASNYTTKTGSLTIIINEGLNGYTWEEVSNICAKGEAESYFSVGDEAVICLDEMDTMELYYYGTLGSITTLDKQYATIVVGDITNTSLTLLFTSYSTQAPAYQMSPSTEDYQYGNNIGGWKATILRTWLNSRSDGGFYNALSSSLKNVITTHISSYSETFGASEVSYCEDKLWLLSAKEVFGGDIATSASSNTTYYENLAAFNVETQLAYFANGNSRIRYPQGTSGNSTCEWWLRSTNYRYLENFCMLEIGGNARCSYACYALGVFPAFTIGYAKKDSFSDYSWSEIQAICKAGLAKEYFNIGDTKTIDIDALPNAYNTTSAQTATIVVGDISSDGTTMTMLVTSYSTKAPSHVMNTSSTNSGGWEATSMRDWLNNEYLSALSSDLQNVIVTHSSSYPKTYNATSVSYCDDKVWLLSEKEVFGIQTSENTSTSNIEKQLDYFATTSDNRVRYSSSTSVSWWWLRSSDYNYSHTFTAVDGYGFSCYNGATHSYDVFPAFDIG